MSEPSYLWTIRDESGQESVVRIRAGSVLESMENLKAVGRMPVALHTDDLMAVEMEAGMPENWEKSVTPEMQFKFLYQPIGTWGQALAEAFRQAKSLFVLSAALFFIAAAFHGIEFDPPVAVSFFAAVGVTMAALFRCRSAVIYGKLNRSKVWRRWGEVVQRCDQLGAMRGSWISSETLLVERACAMAGQGRLREALALFDSMTAESEKPEWLLRTRRSRLFRATRDYSGATVDLRAALALKPDLPTVRLELADILRKLGDLRAAREEYDQACRYELPLIGKPMAKGIAGALAFEEGRPTEARQLLRYGLDEIEPYRRMALMEQWVHQLNIWLCLAEAAVGERGEAARLYGEVKEFLLETGETELLERCRYALGGSI